MDITFAVQPGLHDAATATLRVAVGSFFLISGVHKLIIPERHAALVRTLQESRIPFCRFNEWWVPSWEALGGLALAAGFFTPMAAIALMTICVIATCTDGWKRVVGYNPINKADLLDDLLYLPEVLLALSLVAILLLGPGKYSLDYLIWMRAG